MCLIVNVVRMIEDLCFLSVYTDLFLFCAAASLAQNSLEKETFNFIGIHMYSGKIKVKIKKRKRKKKL